MNDNTDVKVIQPEDVNKEMNNLKEQTSEVEIKMEKESALKLTRDIQSTANALYILIKKAHDQKAWAALGYDSWANYIEEEFKFSRARSYQLLNQANVIEEISSLAGKEIYLSEREAREISKRLPDITEKIKKEKGDAEVLDEKKVKECIKEATEESHDDETKKSNSSGGQEGSGDSGHEDNSAMDEWKPENIEEKMKHMLSDKDKRTFNSLVVTLKVMQELPEAIEFGEKVKKSPEDKNELLTLLTEAEIWLKDFKSKII